MAGMGRIRILLLLLFATTLLVADAWDVQGNMIRKGDEFASHVQFSSRRETLVTATRAGACNIYNGQFVYDNTTRPVYDNINCPHFDKLVSVLNCLKDKKRDQQWQYYSWKPNNCGGGISKFNAKTFLRKMQKKTVFIVGDSLCNMGFFPSMVCQIHRVSAMKMTENDPRFGGARTFTDAKYGVTVAYIWSSFLVAKSEEAQDVQRLAGVTPGHGDAVINIDRLDSAWAPYVKNADLIVLQSAIHWPFVPHIPAYRRYYFTQQWKKMEPQPDTRDAFKHAMQVVARSFPVGGKTIPYFLSVPPRIGGCQGKRGPATKAEVKELYSSNSQSRIWYPIQDSVYGMAAYKPWAFVDLTHPSLFRADAIIGAQGDSNDCLHPCSPGLPDIWVDLFYEVWKRDVRFNK